MQTFNVVKHSKDVWNGNQRMIMIRPDSEDLELRSNDIVRDMNTWECTYVVNYEDGIVYLSNQKVSPVNFDPDGALRSDSFTNGSKVRIEKDSANNGNSLKTKNNS